MTPADSDLDAAGAQEDIFSAAAPETAAADADDLLPYVPHDELAARAKGHIRFGLAVAVFALFTIALAFGAPKMIPHQDLGTTYLSLGILAAGLLIGVMASGFMLARQHEPEEDVPLEREAPTPDYDSRWKQMAESGAEGGPRE